MLALRPLFPLLIAAAILLAGNGLFSTVIAVRGAQEGFSAAQIGYLGSANFLGFLGGCMFAPRILRAVGHVRVFAALASLASCATLVMVMVVDPWVWFIARVIIGFCFSGLFTTIESWMNSGVSNEARGKVTGVYRIIDILAVSGGQFLMPAVGTEGFTLLAIMALMISLSLVPVALGDHSNPKPPKFVRFDLREVWRLSPVASASCIAIGMTNSAFRFVGPLFAEVQNFSLSQVATFISLGVVGGAVLQYPLGMLSDRYDRRWILIWTTVGAVLASLFISFAAGDDAWLIYAGVFVFGAFSLPLYSLAAAHANDRANADQYVLVAAGLMFFYGIGASFGPPVSSLMVELYGPSALFIFISATHGSLALITLYRMQVREAVDAKGRGKFNWLTRTSPVMQRMIQGKRKRK
ncbi:MFS transporter [Ahrensia sp. R2A130]|uniref:MFS transporter n=1 Tax=Ahrensia sp. R2A130 TaxID=744979 RepID=UPI0001E08C18|nr:MFS transporter [Ahrensia sp. R2A130]EFL90551.1 major facilitator transporter [Ahrensia sp. R2A130]